MALPAHGAGGMVSWLAADAARRAATPFADRRVLPMLSRPARAALSGLGYDRLVITAIVMISVESDKIPEVAQQIADVDGVSEVYSVAGDVDLIAVVRVKQFDDIADTIAGRLSKVAGRAAHRHAHRVPRLLAPRPRGDVLDRRRVAPLGRAQPRLSRLASQALYESRASSSSS